MLRLALAFTPNPNPFWAFTVVPAIKKTVKNGTQKKQGPFFPPKIISEVTLRPVASSKLLSWFLLYCKAHFELLHIGSRSHFVAIGQRKDDAREFGVYIEDLQVIHCNGKFTKNIKGKNTDVQDCQWIQKLHTIDLHL